MSAKPLATSALLDHAKVAEYLSDHPDFFKAMPELLNKMYIPHPTHGAVSLVEAQLQSLRERVGDLEEEITQLMSLASRNEHLFRVFAKTQLALFLSRDLKELEQALDDLADALNLTVGLRLYESNVSPLCRAVVDSIKATHFCGSPVYLGRLSQHLAQHFIDDAPPLGSYAILPVCHEKEFGFLTFASMDGGHFQPHMETLFIVQLADQIAVLLHQW